MNTSIRSKTLEVFSEAATTLLNPAMKKWKDNGGKIVGYYCCYVPEEIITAAGILPFRIRATGSTGTELADSYLSSINCSFARNTVNLALGGGYNFLDGAIWLNNCDHLRRTIDIWKAKNVNVPFLEIFSLPKTADQLQVDFFRDQLVVFKEKLENHFGVKITDEKLQDAIRLHNEKRALQRKLYELRKQDKPVISGSETLAAVIAGTAMPVAQYNQLLKDLLEELQNGDEIDGYHARLMIVGGMLDDPEYLKVIEDMGALVVADSICYGSRNFWVSIREEGDPLTAIATYEIMDRPTCPRVFGALDRSLGYAIDMAREYRSDGVIGERIRFCDHWSLENYQLAREFKEAGIPFMAIDREYQLGGIGQMKTRIQAFLETIEGGK